MHVLSIYSNNPSFLLQRQCVPISTTELTAVELFANESASELEYELCKVRIILFISR